VPCKPHVPLSWHGRLCLLADHMGTNACRQNGSQSRKTCLRLRFGRGVPALRSIPLARSALHIGCLSGKKHLQPAVQGLLQIEIWARCTNAA